MGDANIVTCAVESATNGTATVVLVGQRNTVPSGDIPTGPAKIVLRPHALNLALTDLHPGLKGEIGCAAYPAKDIQ